MAGLRRGVTVEEPVRNVGLDAGGDQGGDGAYEAIHQHWQAHVGGGQVGAGEGGDLEAAETAQGLQG